MEEPEGILKKLLKIAVVRCCQCLILVGKCFSDYRFPEFREGPGRVQGLGTFLQDKGIDHVLVITGRQLQQEGVIQPALDSMTAAGIDYSVEAFYRSNPIPEDVENTCQAYEDRHREALVAIGGRSRMDCAKLVAAHVARPHRTLLQRLGLREHPSGVPPLVLVPTSAGTGAEASIDATLTDPWTGARQVYHDQKMMAKYVILDPELMANAPPQVIAMSGMEAVCHIVEGYLSFLYCTRLEKEIAVEAMRRLQRSLLRAYQDPRDCEAIQDVQYAGMLGARIANRCGHGYAYALSHAIEQLYGVSHGEAISAILPATLRMYRGRGARRMGDLAEACGLAVLKGEDASYYLQRWVKTVQVTMGVPQRFKALRNSDFDRIIAMTQAEALPRYSVPEIWDRDMLHSLLRSLQD